MSLFPEGERGLQKPFPNPATLRFPFAHAMMMSQSAAIFSQSLGSHLKAFVQLGNVAGFIFKCRTASSLAGTQKGRMIGLNVNLKFTSLAFSLPLLKTTSGSKSAHA